MNMQEQPQQGKWYQSRLTWVLLGLIANSGFFLVTEHTAHVLGALPFVLFLLSTYFGCSPESRLTILRKPPNLAAGWRAHHCTPVPSLLADEWVVL
jgi:hypothetical protein